MPEIAGEIVNVAVGVATLDDAGLRGGFRSVADTAARDALIGSDFEKVGMLVYVQSDGGYYKWNGSTWDDFFSLAGGGAGYVMTTDIETQGAGAVSSKVYQDTGGTVLQTCVSSSADVRVHLQASYPLVIVNGVPGELTKDGTGMFYSGFVDITLAGSPSDVNVIVVSPDGQNGAIDTVEVTLDLPPELTALSFSGAYPGSQTELKAGDTYAIDGTLDKPATHIEVQDLDAGTLELIPLPGAPTTTFSGLAITIADRGTSLQALPAHVRGRNAAGAFGSVRATNELGGSADGVDLVNLNNLFPSGSWGAPSYPGGQGALKDAEAATLSWSDSDTDVIAFTSLTAELSIVNPVTSEPTKTVNRIGGAYNDSTNNLRATLTRSANDALTTVDTLVKIADAIPVVTVAEPAARLRSGGNDGTSEQLHAITVTSDQEVVAAPDITPEAGGGRATRGIFTGAWASGDNKVWTRSLGVHDDDGKGTFTWQVGAPIVTNLAGRTAVAITGDNQYTLGGFVARSATFAPFQQLASIDVEVSDFSKLNAGSFTNGNPGVKQPIGSPDTTTVGQEGYWTIVAASVQPTQPKMLHTPTVAANAGGIDLQLIEETV